LQRVCLLFKSENHINLTSRAKEQLTECPFPIPTHLGNSNDNPDGVAARRWARCWSSRAASGQLVNFGLIFEIRADERGGK